MMPRWPYRTLGTLLDRVFRNDLNSNFTDISSDMGEQKARVDNLITATPQPSEVVDARVSDDGTTYGLLKDRLDTEHGNVMSQLADIAIDVTQAPYNAKDDGNDYTTSIQNALNDAASNHKLLLIPHGYTFLVDSLSVSNGSNFGILGYGTLKQKNSASSNTILKLSNCSNVKIPFINFDGNVSNNGNTVNQAQHSLSLVGGTSQVSIGKLKSLNPSGDALYINNASDIQVDSVFAKADNFTGRNAVSITNGSRIQIGKVISYKIGYNVAPNIMPSGIDIETNLNTDVVNDITIGELICLSAGSGGMNVLNMNGGSVDRVTVNKAIVIKDASTPGSTNGSQVYNCSNVKIDYLFVKFASPVGVGLTLDGCTQIEIDTYIENATNGINMGATNPVTHFKLTGFVNGTNNHNIAIYSASNGLIDMKLKNPAKAGASYMCVNKNASGTSDNITFKGDWKLDAYGTLAMYTSASTGVTNWTLDNVDLTGWAVDKRVKGSAFVGNVRKINCKNLNYGTAAPIWDSWSVGDYVENTNPSEQGSTVGSKYIIKGWRCVAGNVTGGTWLQERVLTGN